MPSSPQATVRPLGQPGDLGWVITAHGEIYVSEFGWDASFEALVAQIVVDYAIAPSAGGGSSPAHAAWIAELDAQRVGCVFCVPSEGPGIGQLRILLVDPRARGQALGSRLVTTAVEFARTAGYERLRLWTNHPLTAARRIYLDHGFRLVGEEPHHSFGVDLIGQTYELGLVPRVDRSVAVDPTASVRWCRGEGTPPRPVP